MIDDNARTYVVQLLVDFWLNEKSEDSAILNACWQLADKIMASLPADFARRVRRSPRKHSDKIATELDQLILHDPIAHSLARTLTNGFLQSGTPSVGKITGDHNQITLGHQVGQVTQTMNIQNTVPSLSAVSQQARNTEPALLFKLALQQREDNQLEIRALQTPSMGEPYTTAPALYTATQLDAVLNALEDQLKGQISLNESQMSMLQKLGLLRNHRLDDQIFETLGRHLYKSVFVGKVGMAFQDAINRARIQQEPLHLQLCLDEHSVDLARYPWELLHDDRRSLLPSGAIELTRYITYSEAATPLKLDPPLQLLYIASRPHNLAPLPLGNGLSRIPEPLRNLSRTGALTITELNPPTYDNLLTYIQSHQIHILHYDGHGTFKRRCRACRVYNLANTGECQHCGVDIQDIAPEGYLAFEDSTRDTHWVKSSALGNILYNRGIQLAVLLACSSGVVGGETLFTGAGPALIQAGIPAVLATQTLISTDAATSFSEGLYRSLAQHDPISKAVNNGRQRLFLEQEWFIPVLYLRAQR